MALDRNKTILNAEKFVRQGKVEQAIPLYLQVIEATPKDMNLKNKVGDLYVRVGDTQNAIELFGEIAEFYGTEGFYLKAIAVLKKINRLDSANIDCYFKLAELYAKQGLNNDAKSQFQQVAEIFAKEGKNDRAAEALQGILKIEPDNVKVRLKLAELHAKLGQTGLSLEAYAGVGQELIKKGMLDEAVKIFEKGLGVDPGHGALVAGICRALYDLGRTAEAIDRARAAYPNNRENVAMLSVLGDAYLKSRQNEQAAQVFDKLIGLEPERSEWKERLAQARGGGGAPHARGPVPPASAAPAVSQEDLASDLTMDEIEQLSGQDWDVSDLPPETSDAEPASGGGVESERDEFIVEHQTEAEVFIKYGLVEKAIENLEAIVNRYPDETESLRRLKDLYLETGNKSKAAERCVDLARIAKAQGEISKAMDLLAEARAHDPEVDVDRSAGSSVSPAPEVADGQDVYSFGEPVAGESVPVEFDSGTPSSGVELQFEMPRGAGSADEVGDSNYQIDFSDSDSEPPAIDFDMGDGGASGGRGGAESPRAGSAPGKVGFPGEGETSSTDDDGVKFFEEAIRPDRRQGEETPLTDQSSGVFEESVFEQEDDFLGHMQPAAPIASGPSAADDSMDQLLQDLKAGVDAQVESEDYETHYNLGIAYKEMGLIDEAIGEFQQSAKDDGRFVDSCSHLGMCFREKGMAKLAVKWYGKAIEKLEEGSDQYVGVLYDMAEAYEESGDVEKALEMFTDVYGLNSSYREVSEKLEKLS